MCSGRGTDLQLGLEEELLWALRAVVDLILLPVHGEDVLLQLVGLDKDWTRTRPSGQGQDTSPAASGQRPHATHKQGSPRVDTTGSTMGYWDHCWLLPEASRATEGELPPTGCATLGKSLNFSGLCVLIQKMGLLKSGATVWLGGSHGSLLAKCHCHRHQHLPDTFHVWASSIRQAVLSPFYRRKNRGTGNIK